MCLVYTKVCLNGFCSFYRADTFFFVPKPPLSSNIIVTFSRWASFCQLYLQGSARLFFWFFFWGGSANSGPLRKRIGLWGSKLSSYSHHSSLSLFFLLCPLIRKDSMKSLKIWNLKFVFVLKWVSSLNRYLNKYFLKLLTVSFCFLIFAVYLVIVKFIICSNLACNFYIGNCTAF